MVILKIEFGPQVSQDDFYPIRFGFFILYIILLL